MRTAVLFICAVKTLSGAVTLDAQRKAFLAARNIAQQLILST